jgi:hypothetical protein
VSDVGPQGLRGEQVDTQSADEVRKSVFGRVQRAYEANAQAIKVADTMLETANNVQR